MSNLKKVLWATALIGLLICGYLAYTIYTAIFSPNTAFEKEMVYVHIPTEASFDQVVENMAQYLKNQRSFREVAARKGYVTNIKAGKYAIKRGMNNNEIINSLRSGNIPIQVTFNNQESLASLAGRIASQIEADSLEIFTAFSETSFQQEAGFTEETALGMYIPNTYEFFWNTSAEAFRERMLKEYERFWSEARLKKAANVNLSEQQTITLASIVQKETVKVDERPRVAGVYLNRLKRGMPLQADPTVIFAIMKETGNYDTIIKRVLYRDLEMDSPYNTYKNTGLPPGPICMPDISSIDAVLNAENHNYLYFVANVENFGYHKFAETLRQHNENKVQYIRWLNNQKIMR